MGSFALSKEATVRDLKEAFSQKHPKYYVERQWFTVDTARGEALKDDKKPLSELGKAEVKLVFKDLGAQMSWRLVYIIEYFGPVVLFPLMFYCQECVYGVAKEQTKRTLTQQ